MVDTPNVPETKEEIPKKKKKHRFLKFLLGLVILIAIVFVGLFAWYKLFLNPGPNKVARALDSSPIDEETSQMLQTSVNMQGVSILALTMPDEEGNLENQNNRVILVTYAADDIAPDQENLLVRDIAYRLINPIVNANRAEALNIEYSAVHFTNEGNNVVSVSAPMQAQTDWIDGKITDDEFMKYVSIKVQDPAYLRTLVQKYLDEKIGDSIFDALFGGLIGG